VRMFAAVFCSEEAAEREQGEFGAGILEAAMREELKKRFVASVRREAEEARHYLDEGIVNACLGGPGMVETFSPNATGTDWIVGDIHGLFSGLEKALERIGFDSRKDRLFHVGDLIDRGPESEAAAEWLDMTWFCSVRGNHDQMMLDALLGDVDRRAHNEDIWDWNGGDWRFRQDKERLLDMARKFAKLPFAVEIERPDGGGIGILHADAPMEMDWQNMKERLVAGDRETAKCAIWSRARLVAWIESGQSECLENLVRIEGMDLVVSGHTPLEVSQACANRRWIDTGAALDRSDSPGFTFLEVGLNDRIVKVETAALE